MARPRGDNLTAAEAAVFRKVVRHGLQHDSLTQRDLLEADHLGDLQPKDDRWISNALTDGRVVSRKRAYDIWRRYYLNPKVRGSHATEILTFEESFLFDSSIYNPDSHGWLFDLLQPKVKVTVEINTLASDMAACAARRPSASETKIKTEERLRIRFANLLRSKCAESAALVNLPTETCHQCGAIIEHTPAYVPG